VAGESGIPYGRSAIRKFMAMTQKLGLMRPAEKFDEL
jgi:hypothetical protein